MPFSQIAALLVVLALDQANGGDALRKSNAADLANMQIESRAPLAYMATWNPAHPNVNTLLKMLPRSPAVQLNHWVGVYDDHGFDPRNQGFGGELGVPRAGSPTRNRVERTLKLQMFRNSTSIIASLSQVVGVEGLLNGTTAAGQDETSAMTRLLLARNLALYFSDTGWWRGGEADGRGFAGILQQIRERTDGTEGAESPLGVDSNDRSRHIKDSAGDELDLDNVLVDVAEVNAVCQGGPSVMLVSPIVKAQIERSLRTYQRKGFELAGVAAAPVMWGNSVVGFTVGGRNIFLLEDNQLSWQNSWPEYSATRETAHSGLPTASAVAASDTASLWDSTSAGSTIFYYVSEVLDDNTEGLGTRVPSSSYLTVAAGDKVTITITASSSSVVGFRIYRGKGTTKAAMIGGVAAPTSGSTTFVDYNERRPRTDTAFLLPVGGYAFDQYRQGGPQAGGMEAFSAMAQSNQDAWLKANVVPNNQSNSGVMLGTLGPEAIYADLGRTGLTIADRVQCSVSAPLVAGAKHCLVYQNIGV